MQLLGTGMSAVPKAHAVALCPSAGMRQRSCSSAPVALRPRHFLIALIVARCGPTRTSQPRPRPHPVVIAKSEAGSEVSTAAEVQSVWLTDAELEAWPRAGCGPIETAAETRRRRRVDAHDRRSEAREARVRGHGVRRGRQGTIVHERGGELWLVSADGGRRRRLTGQALPADDRFEDQWTDDGRSVTFIRHHGCASPSGMTLARHSLFARPSSARTR